jgi:hypothetical protein
LGHDERKNGGLTEVSIISAIAGENNPAKETLLGLKLLLGFKPVYSERC